MLWFDWVGLEGKQQKIEFLRYFAAVIATATAAATVLVLDVVKNWGCGILCIQFF